MGKDGLICLKGKDGLICLKGKDGLICLKGKDGLSGVNTKRPNTKCSITKHPKHNTQEKTPKISKCPLLQNVQSYKMSKLTKYPKLQNVQRRFVILDIL